jgi:hypothetical protein
MRKALCTLAFAACGAVAMFAPAAVSANSADAAYAGKLVPVFNQMVTAAQKVEAGGNAVQKSNYAAAAGDFKASLTIYRHAQATVNGLKPSTHMGHVSWLVKMSISSYITGVTYYISGSQHHDPSEIVKGVKPYNKGTAYLNQASREMKAAVKK